MKPIAITPGEPAGSGPDILLAMAAKPLPCAVIAVASREMLADRAKLLGLEIALVEQDALGGHTPGILPVWDVSLPHKVAPGQSRPESAEYLLQTLDIAVEGCLSGKFAALVTGPIQKSVLCAAGIPFSGHTEYLAERCGVDHPVMVLASESLRVALQTTHHRLADVPRLITKPSLTKTLEILYEHSQQTFGIERPRIGVCGLNPHAGENGHLGDEEVKVIRPVVESFSKRGYPIQGPLSADTVFRPESRNQYDILLTMYHDQGLPVIKALDFGEIVNLTLGLPMIRTSVDHGVALDLAGTGKASDKSLRAALAVAYQASRGVLCA